MLLSALLLDFPVLAPAAPGDLDPSFDGDGRVLTDFRGFEFVTALVVQSDGKVVAAGIRFSRGLALARYNPDGSLDRSFGGDGKVLTNFGGSAGDFIRALAVQPDGKLVAAVSAFSDAANFILVRFNPDGSFDATFGDSARVVTDFGGRDTAQALVLQPDGKLVAAGSTLSSFPPSGSILARYNPDGSLDTSFGGDGSVFSEVSSLDQALVLQSDGKLVRVGAQLDCSGSCRFNVALERFNPDGSRDTSFGSSGLVVTDFGEESRADAIVLQADGKLVAAGELGPFDINAGQDRVLARYHTDGSLDTSFGIGGVVVTDGGGCRISTHLFSAV